jgi:hypothetical protein
MINYMKDIECISRIPHLVFSKKYANRQSERFKARDQAALNLASIMGTLGMYKEATDILVKPWQSPQS